MKVRAKIMVGTLAVLLGGGAFAQGSGQAELRAIAAASGLQVKEVQMLLSNGPTAYTTWYATYDSSARKLRRAVQEGRVQLLASKDGTRVQFAQWQRLPTRAVAVVASTQIEGAPTEVFGE